MINLKYFYSTVSDGNMNTQSKFYEEGMSKEEIRNDFNERRIKFGKKEGFNGLKTIIPNQKNSSNSDIYPDGHYVKIDRDMIHDYNDLYDLNINADILMMDDTIQNVALAYPVSDCPVVFAYDVKNSVVAMAHCGGEYIDRKLPAQLVDSLFDEVDSKPYDISVYIGPHIQKMSYIYDRIPNWIKHENTWEECLKEENGLIHIDLSNAIIKQLLDRGVDRDSIYSSLLDTYTISSFYSNSASRFDNSKNGRFLEGCFFKYKDTETIKQKIK